VLIVLLKRVKVRWMPFLKLATNRQKKVTKNLIYIFKAHYFTKNRISLYLHQTIQQTNEIQKNPSKIKW